MTSSLIEQFKKQSKALTKAVRERDPNALARVEAVLHDGIAGFGLQKAQHVVAREAGFQSWDHLIRASETQLRWACAAKMGSAQHRLEARWKTTDEGDVFEARSVLNGKTVHTVTSGPAVKREQSADEIRSIEADVTGACFRLATKWPDGIY